MVSEDSQMTIDDMFEYNADTESEDDREVVVVSRNNNNNSARHSYAPSHVSNRDPRNSGKIRLAKAMSFEKKAHGRSFFCHDYHFDADMPQFGLVDVGAFQVPQGVQVYGVDKQYSTRVGTKLLVDSIVMRLVFRRDTGSKATPRIIIAIQTRPDPPHFLGVSNAAPLASDILQPAYTNWGENILEGEMPDLLLKPTRLSEYHFNNVVMGHKFNILYDFFHDLEAQTIRAEGFAGTSTYTKYVTFKDLNLVVEFDPQYGYTTRNLICVLRMGDVFGGICTCAYTFRTYYRQVGI